MVLFAESQQWHQHLFFSSHGSQLWGYTILAATPSVDTFYHVLRPGGNSTACLGVSGLSSSPHLHLSLCLWMSHLPSLAFQFLWVVNFHCTGLWEMPWSRAHVCAGAWRIVGPPRTYDSALPFLFPLQREHVSCQDWPIKTTFLEVSWRADPLGEHEQLYKLPSKVAPNPSVSFKGTVYPCIWQSLFGIINPLRIWTFVGQQMGQPASQFNKVIYFNHLDRACEDY